MSTCSMRCLREGCTGPTHRHVWRSVALLAQLALLLSAPLGLCPSPWAAAAEPAKERSAPGARRTNLVAIVTDDQAQWAVGAYGNADIHTPQMDRLAREGARFTQALVVTPVCSPSRATYLTGLWPSEVGITDWISPAEAEAGLGLDAPTWAEALEAQGYRTALIGKWHLGTAPQFHPTRRGFAHFVGFLAGGNRPMDPVLEIDGREQQLEGPLPDRLVDAAIAFIADEQAQSRPFALALHFRAPHLPYGPVPEEDSAPYRGREVQVPDVPGTDRAQLQQWHREYYASITSIDRNLGRLWDALDELRLADHTLVVFTSDHGYNNGRHAIDTKGNGQWIAGGVRGPKRPNMWDTSLQVPLLVRWPGVVMPGRQIDQVVTTLDMYRTVLAALDVPLPANCRARGRDITPLLRGESLDEPDAVFGQYDLHNGGLAYLRMIRTPQYKFVRHFRAAQMDELYDLLADPGETRNLLGGGANDRWRRVAADLDGRLAAWQQEIGDPLRDLRTEAPSLPAVDGTGR